MPTYEDDLNAEVASFWRDISARPKVPPKENVKPQVEVKETVLTRKQAKEIVPEILVSSK